MCLSVSQYLAPSPLYIFIQQHTAHFKPARKARIKTKVQKSLKCSNFDIKKQTNQAISHNGCPLQTTEDSIKVNLYVANGCWLVNMLSTQDESNVCCTITVMHKSKITLDHTTIAFICPLCENNAKRSLVLIASRREDKPVDYLQ